MIAYIRFWFLKLSVSGYSLENFSFIYPGSHPKNLLTYFYFGSSTIIFSSTDVPSILQNSFNILPSTSFHLEMILFWEAHYWILQQSFVSLLTTAIILLAVSVFLGFCEFRWSLKRLGSFYISDWSFSYLIKRPVNAV